MKLQVIFDRVYRHFVVEGGLPSSRTVDGEFYCAYRGRKGARCAIGLLIPDELYKRSMEGKAIRDMLKLYPAIRELFDGVSPLQLAVLQNIHDDANEASETDDGYNPVTFQLQMKRELLAYAKINDLIVPAA